MRQRNTETVFQEKVARLKRIFRGEDRFGPGTPTEQAACYRWEQLMPEIIRRARHNSERWGPVSLLISLSGFSPATTIIACEVLRPRHLLVISSRQTLPSLDSISSYLSGAGRGKSRRISFQYRPVDPTDVQAIFEIIRESVKHLRTSEAHRPESVMVDITGGKKIMSAAAALAAGKYGLPLCYIESDFDPEMRQPVPGSERLIRVIPPASSPPAPGNPATSPSRPAKSPK